VIVRCFTRIGSTQCNTKPVLVSSNIHPPVTVASVRSSIRYRQAQLASMSSCLSRLAVSGVAGYLAGSIPSADIVSRFVGGPNLRSSGTGNPGAANAAGVLGAGAGLAILGADITKGAIAGRLGLRLGGGAGSQAGAVMAVVGHCYPVWNGFKGGKGVATSVGQVLATFPAYFPVDVAVAVGTAAVPRWKQRAFAATTVSSAAWIAGAALWWRRSLPNLWGPAPGLSLPVGATLSSAVIFSRFMAARPPTAPNPTNHDPREAGRQ